MYPMEMLHFSEARAQAEAVGRKLIVMTFHKGYVSVRTRLGTTQFFLRNPSVKRLLKKMGCNPGFACITWHACMNRKHGRKRIHVIDFVGDVW